MCVLMSNEAYTHSYYLISNYDNEEETKNTYIHLKTRFVRFLVMMSLDLS